MPVTKLSDIQDWLLEVGALSPDEATALRARRDATSETEIDDDIGPDSEEADTAVPLQANGLPDLRAIVAAASQSQSDAEDRDAEPAASSVDRSGSSIGSRSTRILSDDDSLAASPVEDQMMMAAGEAARSGRSMRGGSRRRITTESDATLVGSGAEGGTAAHRQSPDDSLPSYEKGDAFPAPAYEDVDGFPSNPPAVAAVVPDTVSASKLATQWSAAKSNLLSQLDMLDLDKVVRKSVKEKFKKLNKSFSGNLSGVLRRAEKQRSNENYLVAFHISESYLALTVAAFDKSEPGGDLVRHDLGVVLSAIRQHCLSKVGAHPYTYSPADNAAGQKGKR